MKRLGRRSVCLLRADDRSLLPLSVGWHASRIQRRLLFLLLHQNRCFFFFSFFWTSLSLILSLCFSLLDGVLGIKTKTLERFEVEHLCGGLCLWVILFVSFQFFFWSLSSRLISLVSDQSRVRVSGCLLLHYDSISIPPAGPQYSDKYYSSRLV